MTLPEQLPRAKPTDEGPFLLEVVPAARRRGRWWGADNGFTDDVEAALRFSKRDLDVRGWFEFKSGVTYPVCLPASPPVYDLTTRLGRVQAAWWLRDLGAPGDVMPTEQRRAYDEAILGDDDCNEGALAALVDKYREQP